MNTLTAIQRDLEAAGIESIAENGGGPGVRLRKETRGDGSAERAVDMPGDG
jgi:hypothetical protein